MLSVRAHRVRACVHGGESAQVMSVLTAIRHALQRAVFATARPVRALPFCSRSFQATRPKETADPTRKNNFTAHQTGGLQKAGCVVATTARRGSRSRPGRSRSPPVSGTTYGADDVWSG